MGLKQKQITRQRQRSVGEIQELLDALEQSGLSRASFARQHGLGYSTLCSWIYRTRRSRQAPQWVEVSDAISVPSQTPSSPYRFHWPSGLELELGSEFEGQKVQELLNIAQSSCSR